MGLYSGFYGKQCEKEVYNQSVTDTTCSSHTNNLYNPIHNGGGMGKFTWEYFFIALFLLK